MQKKQSKFPIGWIFASTSALIVGLLVFFSLNFAYLGEKVGVSSFVAAIIVALLLIIVGVLVWAKKVSIPLSFRKAATVECCMLVVYIVIVFASIMLSNHFFVVMDKKDTIKKDVTKQINQMDDMFSSYQKNVDNRVAAYDAYLQQVERNKHYNWSKYVEERLNQYNRMDLVIIFMADIDCGDVQQEIDIWKKDMLSKTNGLGLITLMPRVNEINTNLNGTLEKLKELDRKSEKGLNGAHWDYTLTTSNDVLNKFRMSEGETLNFWTFFATIIAALIILLPYIAAERDGRHKGLFWELTHSRNVISHKENSLITGI